MINVIQSMHFNHSTHSIIRTSETCFAFAGKIIVLPGTNNDDDDNNNIGAFECRWVIECDCWCDTDNDDDDDDICAVECRWVIECDC